MQAVHTGSLIHAGSAWKTRVPSSRAKPLIIGARRPNAELPTADGMRLRDAVIRRSA